MVVAKINVETPYRPQIHELSLGGPPKMEPLILGESPYNIPKSSSTNMQSYLVKACVFVLGGGAYHSSRGDSFFLHMHCGLCVEIMYKEVNGEL